LHPYMWAIIQCK